MLQSAANRSYSWWWDSHISPKHSRWLQENLTDMDLKVKAMLKLIEEDADSFSKRAEMYYKKRPELISLVEEFYRAYRALAERYDHITGELHQVQYSMAEAFPNKLEHKVDGDSPRFSSVNRCNQNPQVKEIEGFDAFVKEAGYQSLQGREATQNLHYSEQMEKEVLNQKRGSHFLTHKRTGSPSGETEALNEIAKLHKEILSLQQEKEMLKRDCEKGVQQCRVLEKQAMQMQEELYHVKEETHKVNNDSLSYLAQINELKEEVCILKKQSNDYAQDCKVLRHKLQSETQKQQELITGMQNLDGTLNKSEKLIEVQHELPSPEHEIDGNKFANLQDELSKLQHDNHNLVMQVMTGVQCLQNAEEEAQNLRQALSKSQAENDTMIFQYQQSLSKSQAENDTMIFQYQQSLKLYEAAENRNKDLQVRISLIQEENSRIKDEISAGALHRKIIEEKVQNLEREKNAFQEETWQRIQRANLLQDGILVKHNDEQNLNVRLQDEIAQILRFDTALRNCQQSLSQSQEQQRRLTAELQEGNEKLKVANKRIKFLEEEIHHSQQENNKLMEKSSSLVMSIKNLEQEAYMLKQDKTSLLNEVAFRIDQRDALQQELYCLQEDRNDLDRRLNTIMKQIQSLGFDSESLHSSFVSLQNVSQKLREHCRIGEEENITVPKIVQKMEELINENIALENTVSSHHLGGERLKFEMKLLQQQVQGLQDEKDAIVVESEQHNEHVKALEAKLQNVHNLCSQLCRENQQLKDKFTDELGQMKHLKEQICNLQKDKEALENEIAECCLQVGQSKKEVHSLQEEAKILKDKFQQEVEKEQVLQAEIEDLQQLLCQMDNRNQILSDDCQKHIGKYNAAEEKLMDREKLILTQQAENAMLQHNLSSEKQFNKELELEIDKLQSLFSIPSNSQQKSDSDDMQDTKFLNGIIKEVKTLQMKLSHLQQENELLLDVASEQNANLDQLKKDMSALCTEKESIEKEVAIRLQDSVNLQKEISRLHKAAEVLGMQLAAGVQRERKLELEINNLQQSLTNSLSVHSLLEDEYQRTLEDYNSSKAHIKESQSMLSEMERENQALILDILTQISLATVLEGHIVEKDEKIWLLEEQLSCLQEKNAKLQNELQNSSTKMQMQGAESQLLQKAICKAICSCQDSKGQPVPYHNDFQRVHEDLDQMNFQIQTGVEQVQEDNSPGGLGAQLEAVKEKNECLVELSPRQEYAVDKMTGKELQQQIPMLKEENIHHKLQIPVGRETALEEPLNGLDGERQVADDKISSSPMKANEAQADVRLLQQGAVLDVEVDRCHEALQSSELEMTLLKAGHQKHIDGFKSLETSSWVFPEKLLSKKNKNGREGTEKAYKTEQIEEPEVIVGDLEGEKQIMEAKASSIFEVTGEKNVCSKKAQSMQFSAYLESQEADVHKLQDHWLNWFQDYIGKLQEINKELNHEVQTLANEMLNGQPDIPMVYQIKKQLEEKNLLLKDECQQRSKELCNIWAKLQDVKTEKSQQELVNRSLKAEQKSEEDKILQLHKDERKLKDEIPLQANDMDTLNTKIESTKNITTQKMEIKLQGLQIPSVVSCGLKAKSEEVQDVQAQIAELQATIRDLQQENIQLKVIWQNSTDDIKMETKEELPCDLPHVKGQDLSMMIVERCIEHQEEKEVLMDEFKGRANMEARLRQNIDLLQEETRRFWTRFDSATQQIQKLQKTAIDLQVKFWKLKQDNKKLKDDQWTRIEYNTIEKQLRDLRDDLLIWLEHNGLQIKEVQHRFDSVNRIEQEISALKRGHSGNNSKAQEITTNQTGYLQAEIFSMQGQNRKAADMLQAASDQARGLEFEVERILLRFQQEMETSATEIQKKTYIQRVRVPLRAFFGKKEKQQKQWASFACLRLPIHE